MNKIYKLNYINRAFAVSDTGVICDETLETLTREEWGRCIDPDDVDINVYSGALAAEKILKEQDVETFRKLAALIDKQKNLEAQGESADDVEKEIETIWKDDGGVLSAYFGDLPGLYAHADVLSTANPGDTYWTTVEYVC